MTITVGDYTFEGPYTSTDSIEDRSGIYTIHCEKDGKYDLIDVGESSEVRTRLDNHERKDCWERECKQGTLTYSVKYTPNLKQEGRMKIEQDIRDKFSPTCGKT